MTQFTPPLYLQDGARTVAEMKTAFEQNLSATKQLVGGAANATLTLNASNQITPTGWFHLVDTLGGAASQNLTNILQTNLPDGSGLLLSSANSGHVVTLKHAAGGAGQLSLFGGADLVLTTVAAVTLVRFGTQWNEVSRHYGPNSPDARAFAGVPGFGQNRFTGRQEWCQGAALTAASTVTIGTDGNYFAVNGNATINAFSAAPAGTVMTVIFTGTPLLVHSAVLQLPGGFNFQTQPTMVLDFISGGGGIWALKSGGAGAAVQVIDRNLPAMTISNTAAEITIYAATIPASALTNRRALRAQALLLLADSAGTLVGNNKVLLRAYFGGTQVAAAAIVTSVTDGVNWDGIGGGAGSTWGTAGTLTVRIADWGSSTQRGQITWDGAQRGARVFTPFDPAPLLGGMTPGDWSAGAGGGNENAAAAQLFHLTAAWPVAHPNLILRCDQVTVVLE